MQAFKNLPLGTQINQVIPEILRDSNEVVPVGEFNLPIKNQNKLDPFRINFRPGNKPTLTALNTF